MEDKELVFCVMKLMTDVEVMDVTGEYKTVEISGIRGFIPVFDNIDKAVEASCDGKFKIMEMLIPKK